MLNVKASGYLLELIFDIRSGELTWLSSDGCLFLDPSDPNDPSAS